MLSHLLLKVLSWCVFCLLCCLILCTELQLHLISKSAVGLVSKTPKCTAVLFCVLSNRAYTVTCRTTSCGTIQSCLRCLFRILSMARFGNVAELVTFLGKLDADYAEYAPALWQKGIKTPRQLANFSEPHYLACDVPEGHIDDIKARADTTGELLACNTLYKHIYWNVTNTLYTCTCGVRNPVHVGLQLLKQLLSQLLKACLTACMQSLYSVCKACVFLFCQSILQDNSCLWIMQADLLKRLMRKDQPPQRRPRQVGFTFMTSHHCS